MEVINKKVVLVLILIGIFLGVFICRNLSDKETKLEGVALKNETKTSGLFAIMLQQEDGTYEESEDNMWPSLKYKYNTTNSGCLDVNGTSIPDILSYDAKNQKAIVKTKSVAYCYLYFDIDESVYAKVRNDYTDNTGALLLSETESDEYPVYYYNGNITNNNILYGNFCWKMVRTTETGGVKLIYNGIPDKGEDGTLTCDNTGSESSIGTSKYNSSNASLAYVGYMYNSVFNTSTKTPGSWSSLLFSRGNPAAFYYADTVTWDGSKYVLSNSDGSDVSTYIWADNYTNLLNKYTCLSTTATSCTSVSYVAVAGSTTMYYYNLSEGNAYDYYNLKYATEVTDNGDGTYTLVNPIEITRTEYYENYSSYINHYYCGDNISETCSNMLYLKAANSFSLIGYNIANIYKYGKSFEYKDGKYTLVDTIEFWNWPEDYTKINNKHYTCFNTTGTCEKVYYIHNFATDTVAAAYVTSSKAHYITLSGGQSVEDAINEILYSEDVNKTDSAIKDAIDTWYEDNIIDVLDTNNVLYSTYLENTIWCNSREISDLGGWNPNGGDVAKYVYFNNNSLNCNNQTDQFTLKVESGGTEGYGNNALDYPIGLLTLKEVSLATSGGYLKSGVNYWLLSPHSMFMGNGYGSLGAHLNGNMSWGNTQHYNVDNSYPTRPAVSLSNNVEITSGNGTVSSPYQVILPS